MNLTTLHLPRNHHGDSHRYRCHRGRSLQAAAMTAPLILEVDGHPSVAYLKVVTAEQKTRLDQAVWVSLQRMSGTPCFRGTRVPVQSLIDFFEGGETIDQFIKLYPPITREQVLTVLDFANSQLLECASSLTNA